jgi:hypothetical protein
VLKKSLGVPFLLCGRERQAAAMALKHF